MFVAVRIIVLLCLCAPALQAQDPPPPTPVSPATPTTPTAPAPSAAATATTEAATPTAGPEGPAAARRGERSGRSRGGSRRSGPPRRGIPVTEPLLEQHCSTCHKVDEQQNMSRVSFMRKTPEGWETSLKRMIRHHDLSLSPTDARAIIRYLSNHHGLAREEAKRGLYEAERRVHWSEADHDQDFQQACAACHTLGRVVSQQRDATEWKHLMATHVAFFPLAQRQAFTDRRGRSRFGGSSSEGGAQSGATSRGRPGQGSSGRGSSSSAGNRAERVMAQLAKDQPLFTPEWEAWQVNEREVPVAGTWTVIGHEVSRGDVRGQVTIKRVAEDAYETHWQLSYGDGAKVERRGKAVMYAGYSWRGRSMPKPGTRGEPSQLKEVLLLSEDWNSLEGRIFTGGYNELGMDVTLYRDSGNARVFAADGDALIAGVDDQQVTLHGESLPEGLKASEMHLGKGLEVTAVERLSDRALTLTVNVAADARLGMRRVSFRAYRGPELLKIYDTIDYIKVTPGEGFSRVGGVALPKQLERFEALAMHRGPDKKLYTDDDWVVKHVPAKWHLEEFHVRENDDDLKYVGVIDEKTGVFVPAREGPNPERHYQHNNIGDVYVVATTELSVPIRATEPEKKPAGESAEDAPADADAAAAGARRRQGPDAGNVAPKGLLFEQREFKARGHLLVSVPIYVRYDRFEWDQR